MVRKTPGAASTGSGGLLFVLLAASFQPPAEGSLPVLKVSGNTSLISASHSDNASRCPSSARLATAQKTRYQEIGSIEHFVPGVGFLLLVNGIFSSPS